MSSYTPITHLRSSDQRLWEPTVAFWLFPWPTKLLLQPETIAKVVDWKLGKFWWFFLISSSARVAPYLLKRLSWFTHKKARTFCGYCTCYIFRFSKMKPNWQCFFYCIAGKFRGLKLSRISQFCCFSRKFYPWILWVGRASGWRVHAWLAWPRP